MIRSTSVMSNANIILVVKVTKRENPKNNMYFMVTETHYANLLISKTDNKCS